MLKRNARQRMDGLHMLAELESESAALVIYDPQHREVLDRLKFGNEGARQKKRAKLPHLTTAEIQVFMSHIERVVKPSGHAAIWMDKFLLATGGFTVWLQHAPNLKTVELIAWNKMKIGMGRRARCTTEYLMIFQKPPLRAKDIWTDRGIPDCWSEPRETRLHAHQKPEKLTERLIKAITKPGDLVVDPCAGGYGVLEACRATDRQFLGCDLI
jgi:site-specific DNA-methyltransferase (adenine-specific)